MTTKLSQLKAAFSSGNLIGALRIASRFGQLGEHKEAITRAWAAHQNPRFYEEIGQDPKGLVAEGIAAMRLRYGL